jgi:hypothetical protein
MTIVYNHSLSSRGGSPRVAITFFTPLPFMLVCACGSTPHRTSRSWSMITSSFLTVIMVVSRRECHFVHFLTFLTRVMLPPFRTKKLRVTCGSTPLRISRRWSTIILETLTVVMVVSRRDYHLPSSPYVPYETNVSFIPSPFMFACALCQYTSSNQQEVVNRAAALKSAMMEAVRHGTRMASDRSRASVCSTSLFRWAY